jgi:hypothetical protein
VALRILGLAPVELFPFWVPLRTYMEKKEEKHVSFDVVQPAY